MRGGSVRRMETSIPEFDESPEYEGTMDATGEEEVDDENQEERMDMIAFERAKEMISNLLNANDQEPTPINIVDAGMTLLYVMSHLPDGGGEPPGTMMNLHYIVEKYKAEMLKEDLDARPNVRFGGANLPLDGEVLASQHRRILRRIRQIEFRISMLEYGRVPDYSSGNFNYKSVDEEMNALRREQADLLEELRQLPVEEGGGVRRAKSRRAKSRRAKSRRAKSKRSAKSKRAKSRRAAKSKRSVKKGGKEVALSISEYLEKKNEIEDQLDEISHAITRLRLAPFAGTLGQDPNYRSHNQEMSVLIRRRSELERRLYALEMNRPR